MTEAQKQANQWGVKPHEYAALEALIEHGTDKAACRQLGINPHTFGSRVKAARRKMKAISRVTAAVAWTLFVHGVSA